MQVKRGVESGRGELECEREKRHRRRERMHGRGRESYAGEQDLRELSRARESYFT